MENMLEYEELYQLNLCIRKDSCPHTCIHITEKSYTIPCDKCDRIMFEL